MNLVAYLRVSTSSQGESGLGIEGQKSAIEAYATSTGSKVIARYVEVESGKLSNRPELTKALSHARRSNAVLTVAKLDRLSRNLHFLSGVLESGCEFVACDNPFANRLTLHILAAVAENEAKAISERTKTALQAAKARGTLLGSARPGHWDGREDRRLFGSRKGALAAAESHRKAAQDAYVDVMPQITSLRASGASLRSIAATLTSQGHTTRTGRAWNPMLVRSLLQKTGF